MNQNTSITTWGIHTHDYQLFLSENVIAIGWMEFGNLREHGAWDLRTMISRGSVTRIHYILVSSSPFPKQLLKENTLNNTCRITFRMMDAKYAKSFKKEDGAMHLASPGEIICRWINRRYQCLADHLSYEEVEAAVQITQCG